MWMEGEFGPRNNMMNIFEMKKRREIPAAVNKQTENVTDGDHLNSNSHISTFVCMHACAYELHTQREGTRG